MSEHGTACDPTKSQIIANMTGEIVASVQRRAEQMGMCCSCVAFSLAAYAVIWFHSTTQSMPVEEFCDHFVAGLKDAIGEVDSKRQRMARIGAAYEALATAFGSGGSSKPPSA